MVTYHTNPALKNVNPAFKGNIKINGRFEANEIPAAPPSFLKVLQWQLTPNPQRKEKKQENFRLPVIPNETFMHSADDMIVWLGHASFFIRFGGISFITDPCFYDLPLIKRTAPLPCRPDKFQGIQYLLISHGHRDHFDKGSVFQMIDQNPAIELLMPLEIGTLLHEKYTKVRYQEAGWYQQYNLSEEIEAIFLPAKHWNRRGLTDYNKTLWGSFLLQWKGKKIYFAGDSAYDIHFREIRALFGAMDVCIMPVGAYKPPFMMKEAHMNPTEALQAFHDLEGKIFIPMHYGTYDLSDEPLSEPLALLKNAAQAGNMKGNLKDLAIGENYYF